MEFKKFSSEFSSFEISIQANADKSDAPGPANAEENQESNLEIGFNNGLLDHRGTNEQLPEQPQRIIGANGT